MFVTQYGEYESYGCGMQLKRLSHHLKSQDDYLRHVLTSSTTTGVVHFTPPLKMNNWCHMTQKVTSFLASFTRYETLQSRGQVFFHNEEGGGELPSSGM